MTTTYRLAPPADLPALRLNSSFRQRMEVRHLWKFFFCLLSRSFFRQLGRHSMAGGFEPSIPTRQSLLVRVKDWHDNASWRDFFDTYWKLIYGVARKTGLS